jgi:hypothetical protein
MKNDREVQVMSAEHAMNLRLAAAIVLTSLGLSVASARAGPCTDEIAQFELAVRRSEGKPNAGPFAPQSIAHEVPKGMSAPILVDLYPNTAVGRAGVLQGQRDGAKGAPAARIKEVRLGGGKWIGPNIVMSSLR